MQAVETNGQVQSEVMEAVRLKAVARANADALPGPLAEAFCSDDIQVGKLKVRKIVPRDLAILKAIDSPLHKMTLELVKDEKERSEIQMEDEDSWDIIWQFTNPIERVKEAFAGKSLRTLSGREVGDNPEMSGCQELVIAAVMEQFRRHFQTKIKYAAEAKEGGQMPIFFQDMAGTARTA